MIILNSHCRTGLYKAWQMIIHNLIQREDNWIKFQEDASGDTSFDTNHWQRYHDLTFEKISGVMTGENFMDVDEPFNTFFHNITNPIEPFVGIALDVQGIKPNPFHGDPAKILKELNNIPNELHELPPFGVFGAFNEWNNNDWRRMKERGYKIVNLHRRDMKSWFISTSLCVALGINGWHCWTDEQAKTLYNRRKKLVGKLKVNSTQLKLFFISVERYLESVPADAFCIYEALYSNPEIFIKECELDPNLPMIENYISKRAKHPVKDYEDYLEISSDEFSEMWEKTIPFSFKERFKIDIQEMPEFVNEDGTEKN